MTPEELYELGEQAYANDNYEQALEYYTQSANGGNVDAAVSLPFTYFQLATQVSLDASNHANDTEYLVRGQQQAVNMLDTAIRTAIRVLHDYPDYPYVANGTASAIATCLDLQYALISTGLTIAYRITNTTTHTQKTVLRTMRDGVVVNEEVLWEDILGTETSEFVSLTSYDMRDFHILGPDEKTKRIRESLSVVTENAKQIADIYECIGRECDAHIIRATLACAKAEAEGGDRSALLAAHWFITQAKTVADKELTDPDVRANWDAVHAGTFDNYNELSQKFAALLRSFRKKGQRPYIGEYYAAGAPIPPIESNVAYQNEQAMYTAADNHNGNAVGNAFEVFLTVLAQVSFMKIFPTILFASIISLFCGGIFHVFSADAGIFTKLFGIIWFVITMILTFVRTFADADEFRTNNTFTIYLGIMLGTGLLFSINFLFPLIAFIVLNMMAKKYK